MSKVKAGEWYYFGMTTWSEQAADLAHLLSFFVIDDVDVYTGEWLSVEEDVKSAVRALKAFMSNNIISGNKKRQESQANINLAFRQLLQQKDRSLPEVAHQLRRFEPTKLTSYQKSPQKVLIKTVQDRKHGLMEFMWNHEGTELKITDFYIPMGAVPILPSEERLIAL